MFWWLNIGCWRVSSSIITFARTFNPIGFNFVQWVSDTPLTYCNTFQKRLHVSVWDFKSLTKYVLNLLTQFFAVFLNLIESRLIKNQFSVFLITFEEFVTFEESLRICTKPGGFYNCTCSKVVRIVFMCIEYLQYNICICIESFRAKISTGYMAILTKVYWLRSLHFPHLTVDFYYCLVFLEFVSWTLSWLTIKMISGVKLWSQKS
jgi:hypothetical protein